MSPVKSRREQYTEATRAALLESATRLFAERGFAGTALEDVATATAVTRGAVYHHFANKQALFEAVLEKLEEEAAAQAAAAAAGAGTPWEAGFAALDDFLERCCDPVYAQVVWQQGPIALGWQHWEECEERYAFGLIEMLLRGLVDAGEIDPVPVETATRLVFSLLGAAGMALGGADAEDKTRLKDEYAGMIRRLLIGLRTGPPASA